MDFTETFENIKNKASEAAQTAANKAKSLAQIAKANVEIKTEQEKQKKAYIELGKLFFRDYTTGETSDEAEYLPWCDKVSESVKKVDELKALIDDLKAKDEPADAACEAAEDACDSVCECIEDVKEDICECAEEIKPEE